MKTTSSITLEIPVILIAIVSFLLLILVCNGYAKKSAFAESSYSPHFNNTMSKGPPERVSFSPMADPTPLSAEHRYILEHAEEKTYFHGPSLASSHQPIQGPSPTTETIVNKK